jgi:methylated-DNA-protein-cysteine methyltransferase-like protein
MATVFTDRVVNIIKSIPPGKVATYGMIALWAGNPRGARMVAWILHSSSAKYDLPWHRVVNRRGEISFRPSQDFSLQRCLLEEEGVIFDERGRVDLGVNLCTIAVHWHEKIRQEL